MFEWLATCPDWLKVSLALFGLALCIFWAAVLCFNKQTRETPGDPRKYVAFAVLSLGIGLALLPLDGWHIGYLAMLTGMIAAPLVIGFAMIWGTDQNLAEIEEQAVEENLSRKEKWKLRKHSYVPGTIAVCVGLSSIWLLVFMAALPGTPPYVAWGLALSVNIGLLLLAIAIHMGEWTNRLLSWLVMPIVVFAAIPVMTVWAIATTINAADDAKPTPPPAQEDVVEATEIDKDCPRRFRLTDNDGDGQVDSDILIEAARNGASDEDLAMMNPESLITTMVDAGIWEEGQHTVDTLTEPIGNTLCLNNTAAWYALAEKFPELTPAINEELAKLNLPSVEEYLEAK